LLAGCPDLNAAQVIAIDGAMRPSGANGREMVGDIGADTLKLGGRSMNSVIVASAAFLVALTAPGKASARDATPDLKGTYSEDQKGADGVRVAANAPVSVAIAPVSGVSGTAILLNMKAPSEDLRFVLLQDIPPDVKFSHGFRLKNSWIASIRDIERLQIIPPADFTGSMSIAVLFQRDNQAGAVAQGTLVVEVKPIAPAAEPKTAEKSEPPTGAIASKPAEREREVKAVVAIPPTISPDDEKDGLARGAMRMRGGDIAAARLIYQDLASRGSASGARALAETYDPAYLKDLVIAGLHPDIEAAKKWYKRAAELGDSKSATRLSVLDQR
jgi:hypothetical protein